MIAVRVIFVAAEYLDHAQERIEVRLPPNVQLSSHFWLS
jgi:hypothetical protein